MVLLPSLPSAVAGAVKAGGRLWLVSHSSRFPAEGRRWHSPSRCREACSQVVTGLGGARLRRSRCGVDLLPAGPLAYVGAALLIAPLHVCERFQRVGIRYCGKPRKGELMLRRITMTALLAMLLGVSAQTA